MASLTNYFGDLGERCEVELDGSSLYNGRYGTPIQNKGDKVQIRQIDIIHNRSLEDDEYYSNYVFMDAVVKHDSTWAIYTDNSFEKSIQELLGVKYEWSEQGMQNNGYAHLEYVYEKQND